MCIGTSTYVFAWNICSSKFLRLNWQNFSLIEAADLWLQNIFRMNFFSPKLFSTLAADTRYVGRNRKIAAVVGWKFNSFRCVRFRMKCDLLVRNKSGRTLLRTCTPVCVKLVKNFPPINWYYAIFKNFIVACGPSIVDPYQQGETMRRLDFSFAVSG